MTQPLAGFKASVYVSTGVSTQQTNGALNDSGDHTKFITATGSQRYWDTTVVPTNVQVELDEIQTITITGSPTGGTFTLTFNGQTTSAIAYNASASALQTALQALSSIGSGNCTVTGNAGGPYTVEFTNSKGFVNQPSITLNNNSLTGGSSPSVNIVETQAGQGWTTQSGNYTVQYCGGMIIFNAAIALSSGVAVRATYNYLTVSQALQAFTVEFAPQFDIADITTFASGGWKQKMVLLGDSTFKFSQYWIDGFYLTNLGNLLVMVAYSGANANQQLACYGYLKQSGVKIDVKAPITQDLEFESHGPVLYLQS